MDAMCGWLTGRWDLARDRGEEAQRILLENCGGVSWELGVARNAWLGGLLWAGRWNEYAALLDEFSQDAQDRGDLNSFAIYLMNRCPLRLAQDDAARRTAIWSKPSGFSPARGPAAVSIYRISSDCSDGANWPSIPAIRLPRLICSPGGCRRSANPSP